MSGRLPESVAVPGRPDVQVRLWQVPDAAALTDAVSSAVEHLRPFLPWVAQEPMGREERAAMIDQRVAEWAGGGDAFYGIWVDGRALGAVGAHRRVGDDGLEIGYWLHPDGVGQGLMTAVVRALTSALLDVPGITRVEIRMDEANARSAAIPPRSGYRLAGREKREPTAPAETGRMLVWRFGTDPAPGRA